MKKKNKQREYIRVGDAVEMIFTNERGTVVDHFDTETVIVEMGGEEIPVFLEHLKKIEAPTPKNPTGFLSSNNRTNPKITKRIPKHIQRQQERKRKTDAAHKIMEMGLQYQPDEEPDRGLEVALQPFYDDSGDITYFLIHLINNSGYPLQFDYEMWSLEGKQFEFNKKLGGREKMILNSLEYDLLNESPRLQFKFVLLRKGETAIQSKFEKIVKPKAKMLRRSPQLLPAIGAKVYTYPLFHRLPATPKTPRKIKPENRILDKLKSHAFEEELEEQNFSEKVYVNAEERVIDLHIEKLVKSYRHFRKNQILSLQLEHCQKHLEEAIKRKEKNMVVIHGIGKGKLKSEVFKLLMNYSEVQNFKNEYNHRYGFGATEIFFDYEE